VDADLPQRAGVRRLTIVSGTNQNPIIVLCSSSGASRDPFFLVGEASWKSKSQWIPGSALQAAPE
jgi:hypothetical protein